LCVFLLNSQASFSKNLFENTSPKNWANIINNKLIEPSELFKFDEGVLYRFLTSPKRKVNSIDSYRSSYNICNGMKTPAFQIIFAFGKQEFSFHYDQAKDNYLMRVKNMPPFI